MESKTIEFIARGILFKENKILVCKSKSGGHYFLPGGHIEFGERADVALSREFEEETGENIIVEKFVGAFENMFTEEYIHHEVSLIFLIKCSSDDIVCKEDHIEYAYVTKEDFSRSKFLPEIFKGAILKFWEDGQEIWLSCI